jgi:hypothetical protein
VAVREEFDRPHLVLESQAGLARVALAEGDLSRALSTVEPILAFLQEHNLDGTEEPFEIYLTLYRVLHANEDSRARPVLDAACTLLQERAARIDDEVLRHSFLHNVPANYALVVAREAGQ